MGDAIGREVAITGSRPRTRRAPGGLGLPLADTPGHLIRLAQQVHTTLWAQRLHGELTGPQYAVLASLADEPGLDQTRLSELASLDKNTAADVIRRLVKQGWIDRMTDSADRRRRTLRLTPSANIALRNISPAAAQVQLDLLAGVPAPKRELFVELLAQIAYSHSSAPEPASPSAEDETEAEDVQTVPIGRSPGYLIRRAQQVHSALWADIVGAEVTGPQFAVLTVLADQPGLDQVTVGRQTSLDRSSTAEIVSRLIRAGWLERAAHAADARRSTLDLQPGAAARLRRVTTRARQVQDALVRPLPPDQVDAFVDLLRLVARQRIDSPD